MDNDNAPMGGPLSEADRLAEIRNRAKHQKVLDHSLRGVRAKDHVAAVDDRDFLLGKVDALLAHNGVLVTEVRFQAERAEGFREERDAATARVGVLEGQLATAQARLRELASKQDRIPDTDNGDWGIGWDDGYNAALGEVRYLAAEVLPETVAECHHRQEIYLEWHEFPVQSSKRVICSECSGQLVPWDQVDEASLVLWPCKDAVALGLDGGGSEAETRTTAPDTAMDEFEAADDISRRWE